MVTHEVFRLRCYQGRRITVPVQKSSTAYVKRLSTRTAHRDERKHIMAMISRRSRTPFDMFLSDPFDTFFGSAPVHNSTPNLMRADIKDCEDCIELIIDLPGFNKENVTAELKEGVLTVSAHTEAETEEKKGTYVRKERFSGNCSRSFYVGEDIQEEDVKAKFDNGTLQITVPKKVEQPKLEEARTIDIEG